MKKNGFQDTNNELGNRLKRILSSSPIDNHIIGIPYTLKDYSNLANPFEFWPAFTTVNYRKLKKLLNFNYQYADSLMSRFYIDYLDIDKAKIQINLLKRIWDNKDLLIIEGVYSRTGVGNDLYDNAKSIRRILGPARNAFDSYEKMLDTIKKHAVKEDLILLSYGMTATVLAYDLALLGYWAIDIGHLDLEYEWYRMKVRNKVLIKNKFTNEVDCKAVVEECNDKKYFSQIIENINI